MEIAIHILNHSQNLKQGRILYYVLYSGEGGVPAPWEEKRKKGRGKKGNRGKRQKGTRIMYGGDC